MGRCVVGVRSSSVRCLAATCLLALIACDGSDERQPNEPVIAVRDEAIWANAGFESDTLGMPPASWTVLTNMNTIAGFTAQDPQTLAGLGLATGGLAGTTVVGGATEGVSDPDLGADPPLTRYPKFPKYGMRSVRVNYASASTTENGSHQNVNTLTQQMVLSAGDVDADDGKIHVRFVLMPVFQSPADHALNEQPYYFIQLNKIAAGGASTSLYSALELPKQSGVPWVQVGASGTYYTDWQVVDIAPAAGSIALGDTVELRVVVSGCSKANGSHWGRLYIDAFGQAIPGLWTSATAPSTANPGSDLTYTVHYKNGAASSAAGTSLQFTAPPNTTIKSVSGLG